MIFSFTACGNKNTSQESNKINNSKKVSSDENKSKNEKPEESKKEKVLVMDSSNLGYPFFLIFSLHCLKLSLTCRIFVSRILL